MPLNLARDLMQDRHNRTLQRTLQVLLVTLPIMWGLSAVYGNNTWQTVGIGALTGLVGVLYVMLRRGLERLIAPMLVWLLVIYTTWDIVAYGSVRSAGVIGYIGATAAAGITLRKRAVFGVMGTVVVLLGILTWAEYAGFMGRTGFEVTITFWLTHVTAVVTVSIGTATSRAMVLRALNDQQAEFERRAKAEAESRRSQEQLLRVFQLSPAGILVQSVATREVLDINPAFERIFAVKRENYIGTTEHSKLWVDVRMRNLMVAELLERGRLSNREVLSRRHDGTEFNALLSSEIGGEGVDRIIVSTITDISAEVKARDAVRRSEELFSKAFNFSPLSMTIMRLEDSRFLAINSVENHVLGFSREEMIGHSATELGTWVSLADRDSLMEGLRREGQVVRHETRMRHKLGHLIDCRVWAVVVDIDGEQCVLSCTLNITEEKRREAVLLDVARGVSGETGEPFFRVLTASVARALNADMVLVGEISGTGDTQEVQSIALWSDGAILQNLRYELAGSPCEVAAKWEDMCIHLDRVHETYPADKFIAEGGFRAYMGMALRDADGSPIGVLSALWRTPQQPSSDRDALVRIFSSRAAAELMRARREREILRLNETLEQRVADRTAELQATNAELESFAYSVSHDLQTPLRGIDGFTALLGDQLGNTLSAEQQRMFGRVRINVSRMGELINDLLGLTKVSKRELRRERVDLSALTRLVADLALQALPNRQIRVDVSDGLTAMCDRSLARIALENLIGNAVKYTRPCEVAEIEIGALPRADHEPLVLYIRDNGVGFDMNYADKLFKPFTRLHHDHEFEGSGIGLATVHRIVERHGGGIAGLAAVGQGATFRFSFEAVPT